VASFARRHKQSCGEHRELYRRPSFLLRDGNGRRRAAGRPLNRHQFQSIASHAAALHLQHVPHKAQKSADIPTFDPLTGARDESQAIRTWPGKTGDDLAAAKPVR